MTTETTDTTRLTDEQVQESLSWLSRAQQAESHTVAVALWANTYGHQLHAHITTLAADLARAEAERDRLQKRMVVLGDHYDIPVCDACELPCLQEDLVDNWLDGFQAVMCPDCAETALNGDTDAE